MTAITIVKFDHNGLEKMRYPAKLLFDLGSRIDSVANFHGEAVDVNGIIFSPGDIFMETYFRDRWYNIYEIYDGGSKSLKGWYCNIAEPAIFDGATLSFRDLALDLLIYPNRKQIVLDEDEFEHAQLSKQVKENAINALNELQAIFSNNQWGKSKYFPNISE